MPNKSTSKVINLQQRQAGALLAWTELVLQIREDTRGRVEFTGPVFSARRRAVGISLVDTYNDYAFVIYSRAEWAEWQEHNGWGGNDAA